jgi:hypothetical protein
MYNIFYLSFNKMLSFLCGTALPFIKGTACMILHLYILENSSLCYDDYAGEELPLSAQELVNGMP